MTRPCGSQSSPFIDDNLTSFEAVLADLGEASPDLVMHGGDRLACGSRPAGHRDQTRPSPGGGSLTRFQSRVPLLEFDRELFSDIIWRSICEPREPRSQEFEVRPEQIAGSS